MLAHRACECLDAECLGRVVTSIDDHESRLLGIDSGVMRSFTDDERVGTDRECFAELIAGGTASATDRDAPGPSRFGMRRHDGVMPMR